MGSLSEYWIYKLKLQERGRTLHLLSIVSSSIKTSQYLSLKHLGSWCLYLHTQKLTSPVRAYSLYQIPQSQQRQHLLHPAIPCDEFCHAWITRSYNNPYLRLKTHPSKLTSLFIYRLPMISVSGKELFVGQSKYVIGIVIENLKYVLRLQIRN